MYFRGVSTRKVTQIVEEFCGHGISKSQVSELAKNLDKGAVASWKIILLAGEIPIILKNLSK